jgi:hypothetical protein
MAEADVTAPTALECVAQGRDILASRLEACQEELAEAKRIVLRLMEQRRRLEHELALLRRLKKSKAALPRRGQLEGGLAFKRPKARSSSPRPARRSDRPS